MIHARTREAPDPSGPGGAAEAVAETFQPAFVLSCERSGSTLLRWLLDTHEDISSPGELRLGRLAHDLYVTLSRTVTVDSREDPTRHVRETLAEVRRVLDQILERYACKRGSRVWCEKTPENLQYLDALANAYPDGRYVCLYRNCADVVRSCLEISRDGFMGELVEYARRRPDNLVEAMAESWADKTSELMKFELRNPELCRRVRYEDLVASPEETLRGVFEFLGVPCDADVRHRAFAVAHDCGGGDVKIQETDEIRMDRAGGWGGLSERRLSPRLRERVNSLSRRLGYATL